VLFLAAAALAIGLGVGLTRPASAAASAPPVVVRFAGTAVASLNQPAGSASAAAASAAIAAALANITGGATSLVPPGARLLQGAGAVNCSAAAPTVVVQYASTCVDETGTCAATMLTALTVSVYTAQSPSAQFAAALATIPCQPGTGEWSTAPAIVGRSASATQVPLPTPSPSISPNSPPSLSPSGTASAAATASATSAASATRSVRSACGLCCSCAPPARRLAATLPPRARAGRIVRLAHRDGLARSIAVAYRHRLAERKRHGDRLAEQLARCLAQHHIQPRGDCLG
jgi:hypothetical protein